MKIEDILAVKGTVVHRTSPNVTLQEVVDRLMDYHIGSLVVCSVGLAGEEEVVGVITDRDVLFAVATGHRTLDELTVDEAMTTELITGTLDDEVEYVMGLMTNHRIRHLPVLDKDGQLAGIISIGDVVKAQHDRLAMENRFMKDYIGG